MTSDRNFYYSCCISCWYLGFLLVKRHCLDEAILQILLPANFDFESVQQNAILAILANIYYAYYNCSQPQPNKNEILKLKDIHTINTNIQLIMRDKRIIILHKSAKFLDLWRLTLIQNFRITKVWIQIWIFWIYPDLDRS